ncbi:hypothetical protein JN535_10720 [Cellulosimicrobium cellulans]|uniref:hypothetical protein n=1 Tax=Cellulosimicrobium cellulans TaxID=1710 RepID=UPI001962F965|nr:hypothetical protein [Cellulosimicrobium cellulans]MBN0040636.1 hypothetical protein [Cellulosimicrobium cellulans]
MTDRSATPDPRVARDATPPGTAALLLRPFGYLAIGLVWTTIGLFVVGLYLAVAAYGLFEPPADQELWSELVASPGAVLGRLAVVAPIVVVLAGPVAWYLSCAIWPLAALSFVYAGRALRPSYRGDRLSFTSRVAPGTTLGPPVPGPVAMSLQPQRRSRLTDTLVRFSVCGWNLDLREFWPAVPAGIAWALASTAASTALPSGWRVGLVVAAVPFALGSVVALRRAWRWRFHRERVRETRRERWIAQHGDGRDLRDGPRVVRTRPQSAEHRARVEAERAASRGTQDRLSGLTSDEIGERREAVLRARREREAREARERARRGRPDGTASGAD